MVEFSKKNLGLALVGFSLALLFLLFVVKTNYDSQAGILCEKLHQEPGYNPASCPVVQDKTSWFFMAGFVIGFVVLLLGLSLFLAKSQENPVLRQTPEPIAVAALNPEEHVFAPVNEREFDEDEKKVYALLKQKGGSAFQSDVINATGFSKVTVSRVLDRLESKNVLERKRRGMTNIIVLK